MRHSQLLRSSTDLQSELPEGAAPQIHVAIKKTAEAYQEASILSPTSTSAAYHARFLLSLVYADMERTRQAPVKEVQIDPNIQHSKFSPHYAKVFTNNSIRPLYPDYSTPAIYIPAIPFLAVVLRVSDTDSPRYSWPKPKRPLRRTKLCRCIRPHSELVWQPFRSIHRLSCLRNRLPLLPQYVS